MSQEQITLKPSHMTATSIIITPDKAEAVITFYAHEFSHKMDVRGPADVEFQVQVNLIPQLALSMSAEQALALSKSLKISLEENDLWTE